MGDCRICIQILKQCLVGGIENKNHVDLVTVSTKLWSADSTIYELFESTSTVDVDSTPSTMHSLIQRGFVSVWDCTSYPPQNITELCKNTSLCRSKTLFSVGWFPSGSLQFLPPNVDGPVVAAPDSYDDIQYNRKPIIEETECDDALKSLNNVMLLNGECADVAPSRVLQGIVDRFKANEEDNKNDQEAFRIRQEFYLKRKEEEALRNRKLDDRIRKLASNGKNQPVSDQVRKMLIKSRATGRTSIRPDDRVYLHCLLWDDESDVDATNDETFRFFSIQDTIGHTLESFRDFAFGDSKRKEMLVKMTNFDNTYEYRKLPYALRLYDAIDQKMLSKEVNTVIIRCLSSDDQGTTLNAVATNNGALDSQDMVTDYATRQAVVSNDLTVQVPFATSTAYDRLVDALKLPLQKNVQNKMTKSSAAKEKVRQMQMKSKAKGDAKRIKAIEQRFFLHCIAVVEDIADSEDFGNASIQLLEDAPIFVSRLDPMHRLLREHAPGQSVPNYEPRCWTQW